MKMKLANGFPFIALKAPETAASLGISRSTFFTMVDDGRMPRPKVINSCRVWDIDEVSLAFKALPHDGEEESKVEVDTWADLDQK